MKLYEQSIFFSEYENLTLDGVTDAFAAIDNDKMTKVESAQADPELAVDFGSGETRTANALWMRTEGYTNVRLMHNNVPRIEIADLTIPSDGYIYYEFTDVSNRYWSLDFTGTGSVYEVYLCRLVLNFDTDDKRPYRWRMPRAGGTFYRAANAELLGYNPIGKGRTEIQLDWDLLDNESVSELKTAWESGFSDNNFFSVYPVPEDRPHHFFQCRWDSPFDFTYTGRRVQDGQSGQVVFTERDVRLGGV